MYTVYYLLFNTVYIKNSPTCFEQWHSSFSGTQLFITPAIYVWYSLKYISWVVKMPLTVLRFGHCISYFMLVIWLLVVTRTCLCLLWGTTLKYA
jgi:hypothetical protein